MKNALVIGASGGIGYALALELVSKEVNVVAFARRKNKLATLFSDQDKVTIFSGDALNHEEVSLAAKGVDVIFHAISFPYEEWSEKHVACMKVIISVAKQQQAKIALVDNIYAYGKQARVVTEDVEKKPNTKKGKIRLEMETKIKESGIPYLIVHLPDFYGPNADNTILAATLRNVVDQKGTIFVGPMDKRREFLFTNDGAKAMVTLASSEKYYNQNWNIPSGERKTGAEIVTIIRNVNGYKKPVRSIGKSMIRFLGLFNPSMKEMVEMMYLTKEPVLLSGMKYQREVGEVPATSLEEGISATLRWSEERKSEQ
ncbi:SDR family NAD(P)-dependent oxidoreductase [Salipaludibacillus daqingensis]|uniref:SDR family NAD(P)-dependent oxidoreductase n=1 Tax=Salipaludibacillus daqingensis TaxID=3041001 RepID=UPI002473FF5F|nr:SDR family NAD(P)-dependent oxidoreductase [Salipaludibacillus daqingensis]